MILKGNFIDTPKLGQLRVRRGYLETDHGTIKCFTEVLPKSISEDEIKDFGDDLVFPGLCDLHLHAPQYSYAGTAMDLELIDWLDQYTFPEEARFENTDYARQFYSYFCKDLLQSATTRACMMATLHTDATLELMSQMENTGIISYVGKLNMNRNSPDYYRETSTETGTRETLRWLKECKDRHFERTAPVISPRFTPSVTDDYMCELGKIAIEQNLPVQSHLSENQDEIKWVSSLCPETQYYGQTYDRFHLMGSRTIMAHCIYSDPEERRMLKEKQVMIAHCPTSNENVIAGICPAAWYLRNGYRIGLGSDVAGGHTLNMFAVIAAAVHASKLHWKLIDPTVRPLTIAEALYMATVGGGKFWGKVGLFEPGYSFDAVIINDYLLNKGKKFTIPERVERYCYLGDGRPAAKYVAGLQII